MKSKEYQEKKNSEYWEKRIANSTWKQYNSLEERNKKLLEFYIDASESIKDELYTLAEKYSKDGVLSRTEMHKQNRLQKLNQNFEKIIEDLGHKVETFAKENMQQGFENVNENIATEMSEIDFAMPNKNLMEKLFEEEWRGDSFSGRLWKNQRKLARGLNSILLVGLQQGKTATEMAIQLHNFMGKGFNECHRLVRTETMHYLNSATLQRYKNANVEYVQIWAAADERTCTTCGGYHTKTYPIEKAPILPLHANCRCTYLPVTDKEMITQHESKMDFMGQPNIFQNNQIRVKGYKVDGTDNIYTQTNTSNAKKTIEFLSNTIKKVEGLGNVSKIIVSKDIQGVAAYDHSNDWLFVNERLCDTDFTEEILGDNYFVADNPLDVVKHEMYHKKHWDYIKTKGTDYAIIKNNLEVDLRKYVAEQQRMQFSYLEKTVSINASDAYYFNSNLNELVAEVLLQEDKGIVKDEMLLKLVRRCIGNDDNS